MVQFFRGLLHSMCPTCRSHLQQGFDGGKKKSLHTDLRTEFSLSLSMRYHLCLQEVEPWELSELVCHQLSADIRLMSRNKQQEQIN